MTPERAVIAALQQAAASCMTDIEDADATIIIREALLAAERHGREEGLEEAAKVVESFEPSPIDWPSVEEHPDEGEIVLAVNERTGRIAQAIRSLKDKQQWKGWDKGWHPPALSDEMLQALREAERKGWDKCRAELARGGYLTALKFIDQCEADRQKPHASVARAAMEWADEELRAQRQKPEQLQEQAKDA